MSGTTLESLLQVISDGEHTEEQLVRARQLLLGDGRFPDELRDALDEEPELGAGALLGLLGVDDGLGDAVAEAVRADAEWDVADAVLATLFPEHAEPAVAQAVRDEAGTVEVSADVLEELERTMGPVGLAQAVRAEAGTIDIADDVVDQVDQAWLSAMLDHELQGEALESAMRKLRQRPQSGLVMTEFANLGRQLRSSLQDEAGEAPSLWAAIAPQIGVADADEVRGWDGEVFAEAVREQAGTVDVADVVMAKIVGQALHAPPRIPAPANDNRWQLTSLAVAVVALFVIAVAVPGGPSSPDTRVAATPLLFASADEIVVNELSVADNATATVYRGEGENAPVIILVNEEVVL